jgi:hypothetical protein
MPLILHLPRFRCAAKAIPYAFALFGITFVGRAQVVAPQIASISLTSPSPLTAGSSISYSYSITIGTNPVQSVVVKFTDPGGFQYTATSTDGAAGTISLPTSAATWLNGSYVVNTIVVTDTAGFVAQYSSAGTSFSISYTYTETGATSSAIDPTSLGFTLTGGQAAIIAPSLTSLSIEQTSVVAGENVTINYAFTPGTMTTVLITLDLRALPGTGTNLLLTGFISGPSGSFTAMVPTGTTPQVYNFNGIQLDDYRGFVTYDSNGDIAYYNGETGANPYPGSFSAVDLTVFPPLWVSGDIDHDGKPDIFWTNTSSGERGAYLMNGTTTEGWADLGTVPLAWRIGAVADFTENGYNDILWQNTVTGECGFYLMQGTTVTGWAELGTVPTQWRAAAAADFERNGNNDILWENTSTGECGFYLMNGTTVTGWAELGTVDPSWRIAGAADFNGDGYPDILWQNTVTGQCGIYLMNGTTVTGWVNLGTFPTQWRAVAVGQFSGYGTNDILWQNTVTGECGFYLMNETTVAGWVELGTIPTQWQVQE